MLDKWIKEQNDKAWKSILNLPIIVCPKCKKQNCTTLDVGEGCDYRLTCPDCKFTKCYDRIDS